MDETPGDESSVPPGEAQVVFMPSGRRGRVAHGTNLLDAARTLGVYLESACGGQGLCSRCQIEVAEGVFAKHRVTSRADHLTGWTEAEQRWLERKRLKPGRRLGCRAQVLGDLVIDVPADARLNSQMVRKQAAIRDVAVDPLTRLYPVTVEQPDMHKPMGDFERLVQALADQQRLAAPPAVDIAVLGRLQTVLRQGDWRVTAAVQDGPEGSRLTALWPGERTQCLGAAVDVGSTTIAVHLCDLAAGRVVAQAGMMNPQIRYGEDVMSRVSYVMMNEGAQADMCRVVREAIMVLIASVTAEIGAEPEDVVEVVLVGNPIMHHLFLGLDPRELGGAPFALASGSAVELPARELGLATAPGGRAYVLPCVAGHVGADAAAMVLAEAPYKSDALTLLIDVGTNAEIVLGDATRVVAASSPTGPAFEGAEITCGQRAAKGAVERVRIDPETLEARLKIIGVDDWSDAPGFAAASAKIGITGICGSGIIEAIAEMYLAGILSADGVIQGSLAARSPHIQSDGRTWRYVLHPGGEGVAPLFVTQSDVRAIQLAKAALYAGVKLLMARLGVERVERIRLAGAFGSHIDVKYAMVLGMIPDCPLDQVAAVGNAAGTGARMALVNRTARAEIEEAVRRIEKVETAVEADFQRHFVDAMAIPNKRDAYPNLARVVPLPGRDAAGAVPDGETTETRPRRRRRSA